MTLGYALLLYALSHEPFWWVWEQVEQRHLLFALLTGSFFLFRLTIHALAGRTIGKALLRLQVTDQQGHPCGLWRALIRKVFFVLSSLCACGVGLFWAGFDPYKQGWHDLIAGTVVLKGQ